MTVPAHRYRGRLPAAVGVIHYTAAHYAPRPTLDHLYDDVSSIVDVLDVLGHLITVVQHRIELLPGIVDGLRVDPDAPQVHPPEELRDLTAALLHDLAEDLRPLAARLRLTEHEFSALFVERTYGYSSGVPVEENGW